MKYILLNRQNIVVDILDEVRYIKLQSSNGIVVACEEQEGTGVIGSDCNTHYTLIKADINNDPNAVRIIEKKEIPSNVRPNLAYLDTETNEIICDLDRAKLVKQEENKTLFAQYLSSHPLTWVDGKEYGITLEDQSEINLKLNQYQIAIQAGVESPILEWHARQEGCIVWQVDQLMELSLAISKEVYPAYYMMNQYKTAIFNSSTIEELEAIKMAYEVE